MYLRDKNTLALIELQKKVQLDGGNKSSGEEAWLLTPQSQSTHPSPKSNTELQKLSRSTQPPSSQDKYIYLVQLLGLKYNKMKYFPYIEIIYQLHKHILVNSIYKFNIIIQNARDVFTLFRLETETANIKTKFMPLGR